MVRPGAESQTAALQSYRVLDEGPAAPAPFVSSTPNPMDAVEAVEEPLRPAQPLEDRGDAMLFEIDALGGMPFDQTIVMPFE